MNTAKESCDEFKKVTEKKLHGHFLREMKETASEKS